FQAEYDIRVFHVTEVQTCALPISWGLDLARTSTEQYRDGLRSFPLTGTSTPSMPPDVFPVRDFPLSRTTNSAAYLQDEIGFADEIGRASCRGGGSVGISSLLLRNT